MVRGLFPNGGGPTFAGLFPAESPNTSVRSRKVWVVSHIWVSTTIENLGFHNLDDAMAASKPVEPFLWEGDMAKNWARFKRAFVTFLVGYHEKASDAKKIAMLLHEGGSSLHDIFDSLSITNDGKAKLDEVLAEFDKHFIPSVNVIYERFLFFTRRQGPDESYEAFAAVLRNLSNSCEFGELRDSLIRDIFVCGITDTNVQKELLCVKDLTIEKALELCRALTVVARQVQGMSKESKQPVEELPVDFMSKRRTSPRKSVGAPTQKDGKKPPNTSDKEKGYERTGRKIECKFCGYSHFYGNCPAYGKKCAKCREKNHFASCCPNRDVHEIDEQSGGDSDRSDYEISLLEVSIVDQKKPLKLSCPKDWYAVSLELEDRQRLNVKIDTGAQCNVISLRQYQSIGHDIHNLLPTKSVISSFSRDIVPVMGKCYLRCRFRSTCQVVEFLVVKHDGANLLGLASSEKLGLIRRVDLLIADPFFDKVIPQEFRSLFDGEVGCIPDPVTISVDRTVKPVVLPGRRIPHALMPKVKTELDKMVAKGIVTPVTEPTDWVSQMVVVVKKDGSLRICLDPGPLNKAIKRAHFQFPLVEDIAAKLKDAKYFCKLDAQSGFWMLQLDAESSKLCTFQTPWGRYSFLRLPFGIRSAPEIFHRILAETFAGIENVESFQDDILLWAKSEEELQATLMKVLKAASNNGIKFNPAKCKFNVQSVEFLGHSFGPSGMKCDPEKIKAVSALRPPKDKQELQKILGVFNYVSKFIKNFADSAAPLRELLKKDVYFTWNAAHDEAFNALKQALVSSPVLSYYDPDADLTLSVDSSSYALGAALLQHGKPVAYASRTLTSTQQGYSQIEKECLAVCFGAEKFRNFILGRDSVKVQTDHKPLLGVFKKPLHKVPARLQRMLLTLQSYTFNLVHVPGKELYLADLLSRQVAQSGCDLETDFDTELELQVCLVMEHLPVSDQCFKMIKCATDQDETLVELKAHLRNGWVTHKALQEAIKPYYQLRHSLVEVDGVIFHGDRILVPSKLKSDMLCRLHTGHPGTSRMLSRAEMSLFWLGINQDVKKFVSSCSTCQKYQPNNVKLPLTYKEVPALPWQEMAGDVCEIKNHQYLVLVDALSNYIEVAHLSSLKSAEVIKHMKSVFARHGVPLKIFSDGALYFDSELFRNFASEWGFTHVMSSPHYPKSNGLAESAVKTIKKIFIKATDANEDPYLALLQHRNNPRGDVHSPASILMGRNLRTNIPCAVDHLLPKLTYERDRDVLKQQKEKAKYHHDLTAQRRPPYASGQPVWFKKMPDSTWSPGIISELVGYNSYWVEGGGGGRYRRNESHLRPRLTETVRPMKTNAVMEKLPRKPSPSSDSPATRTLHQGNSASPRSLEPGTPPRQREVRTRSGRACKTPKKFEDYDIGFD